MVVNISRAAYRSAAREVGKRSFSSSRLHLADHVRIVEVGPRDGLQNEKKSISVATKVELIRRLARTGVETIEAASFVRPKWVPQMAASDEVLSKILTNPPESTRLITYQWLLPNAQGLENFLQVMAASSYPTPPSSPTENDSGPALNTSSADPNAMPSAQSGRQAMSQQLNQNDSGPALNTSSADPNALPSAQSGRQAMDQQTNKNDSGPALNTSSADPNAMPSAQSGFEAMNYTQHELKHEVSIFMAATESFSKANTNCTIQESLERFAPLMVDAKKAGYAVRAYISVALGCPFEGPDVDPHRVADIAASLLESGADEISVADTTGMGTAPRTRKLLQTLKEAGIRNEDLALHFHDTFGQALVNTMVSLDHGVRTFDSAVGGLGGCPYSPGATGNVATEDLVYMLHSLGAKTGIDLEEMSRIGEWITGEIGRPNSSSAGKATLARLKRDDK